MKKLLFPICLSLLLPSCASYRMEGKTNVPNLDGQKLYLKASIQDSIIDLDSCEVIHGLFSMEGEVDTVTLGAIYLCGESLMPVVIEKGNIKIFIENSGLKVTGTPLNDRLYRFINDKNQLEQNLSDIQHKQMQLIMDGVPADDAEAQIKAETDSLVNGMNHLISDFIVQNFDNILSVQIFAMYCQSFPQPVVTPLIDDIIKQAPESFKNNTFVKEYLELAKQVK